MRNINGKGGWAFIIRAIVIPLVVIGLVLALYVIISSIGIGKIVGILAVIAIGIIVIKNKNWFKDLPKK